MSIRLIAVSLYRKAVLARLRVPDEEGLAHKVNLGLTLWSMPECLASQGCIDEAEKFQPGAEISRWKVCRCT